MTSVHSSSSSLTPITLTIHFGASSSYELSSTNDVHNTITLSTTLQQIKERIALLEDFSESYPVEHQRLYHVEGNSRHYLPEDDRTLMSYGIAGRNIMFHLGRSNQRRRLNTNTSTSSLPPSNDRRTVRRNASTNTETQSTPPASTTTQVTVRRQTALISYRRADELFEHLQQRMTELRELQNAQMIRRSQRQHLDSMVDELLENCSEISDVLSMSPTSCSEHVLNTMHFFKSLPASYIGTSCVICNVDFTSRTNLKKRPIVKTSCNHVFHRECLKKWMIASDNLTCPLCRSRV